MTPLVQVHPGAAIVPVMLEGMDGASCVLGHVFLDEPRTEVDIELHEWNIADALETVNFARFDDKNVSGARLEFRAVDDVAAAAFANELDLVVGMPVRPRTAPRSSSKEEYGSANIALFDTNEIVRAAAIGQILLSNSVHVSSSGCVAKRHCDSSSRRSEQAHRR